MFPDGVEPFRNPSRPLMGFAEFIIGPAQRVRPSAGPMTGSGRTRWLNPYSSASTECSHDRIPDCQYRAIPRVSADPSRAQMDGVAGIDWWLPRPQDDRHGGRGRLG